MSGKDNHQRKTQNIGNENEQPKEEKIYDLEERTYNFSKRVNDYTNKLPFSISNIEIRRQLIRAGGSIGANYIEANEALSRKDFRMRIKISKKESKEARYWLRLTGPEKNQVEEKDNLIPESIELMKIFASILKKSELNDSKKSKTKN